MKGFNYGSIIDEMVEDLKKRVEDGEDMCEAAAKIVNGSYYVIYSWYHYKVLDSCNVNPTEVVSNFGIDYASDFDFAIAQTAAGCLCLDLLDAYDNREMEQDD